MKKLLVLMLSIIAIGKMPAQDIKLDEIISRYLNVIGQDKLMNIQTIKTTGKMTQGGIEFLLTSYEKRPDYDRAEMEIQGVRIIFVREKDTGWMINPMTGSYDAQDLPEEMIKNMGDDENSDEPDIDWNNPFFTWKEIGANLELIGKEELDGTPVYNIKITFKDNHSVNYFMDASRFIVLSTRTTETSQGQTYESETKYSDFRKVEGVMYAGKNELFVNGQLSTVMIIDTVEFDLQFDDSLFNRPAQN